MLWGTVSLHHFHTENGHLQCAFQDNGRWLGADLAFFTFFNCLAFLALTGFLTAAFFALAFFAGARLALFFALLATFFALVFRLNFSLCAPYLTLLRRRRGLPPARSTTKTLCGARVNSARRSTAVDGSTRNSLEAKKKSRQRETGHLIQIPKLGIRAEPKPRFTCFFARCLC